MTDIDRCPVCNSPATEHAIVQHCVRCRTREGTIPLLTNFLAWLDARDILHHVDLYTNYPNTNLATTFLSERFQNHD